MATCAGEWCAARYAIEADDATTRHSEDDRRRIFGLQPAGRRALAAEAPRLTRLAALVRAKRLITGER
jgi:hypothetical protein